MEWRDGGMVQLPVGSQGQQGVGGEAALVDEHDALGGDTRVLGD